MCEREAEDDDVEPIPGIAQVRELVEDEAARQRFYRGLHRVDDREGRPTRVREQVSRNRQRNNNNGVVIVTGVESIESTVNRYCTHSAADGVSGSVMKPQFTMIASSTSTLNNVHARAQRTLPSYRKQRLCSRVSRDTNSASQGTSKVYS